TPTLLPKAAPTTTPPRPYPKRRTNFFPPPPRHSGAKRNRESQGTRHQFRQPRAATPGRAHHRGDLAELQIRVLVWRVRTGRNAAADPEQGQRGHRQSPADARRQGEIARARLDPGTDQAS